MLGLSHITSKFQTAAIFVMADIRAKKLHSQFVGIVKFLFNESVQEWLFLH
jgi:hypothetical protein